MATPKSVVVAAVVALSACFAVVFFWRTQFLLTLVLFVLAALFLLYRRDKKLAVIYFLGFFCGPTTEIVAIYAGAWHYTQPLFLGIPLWLPFLWGVAALCIGFAYSALVAYTHSSHLK